MKRAWLGRGIVVATLYALGSLAAAASHAADARVLVAVIEAGSNRQVFALESGQAFQIQVGGSVRLELIDPAWDNPAQRHRERVAGRFTVSEPAVIKLSGENLAEGSVWAKAMAVPRNGQPVRVSFAPQGGGRRGGEILVGVVSAAVALAPAPPPPDRVQGIVTTLYRGILLRDPDPGGLQAWVDTIRQNGFLGVLSVAHDIADSRESKIDVYSRANVNNQQRLAAMYKVLLGRDTSSVDPAFWQMQLARLNAGDVASVVDGLVRSPEFLQAQGFGGPRH